MLEKRFCLVVAAACLLAGAARADLVTARIGPDTAAPGRLTITGDGDKQAWKVEVDFSALPKGATVYRAYLHARRSEPITGREDWALTSIEITPLGPELAGKQTSLKLVGPWYDRFDATEAVRKIVTSPATCRGFSIDAFPKLDARSIYLHLEYEGRAKAPTKQPTGLRVLHRAGQTFITWVEVDKRVKGEQVTWGVLKRALDEADAKGAVRYRVYRHTAAITARNVHQAQCLADVKPLSCYNVDGRSVERLISMHTRRVVRDIPFARRIALGGYFGRYRTDMPKMDEVSVDRFVIDGSGKPLPLGSGLYVHNPPRAGKAYYAVATSVDGATNTVDFSPANATATALAETVGVGEPVFQGPIDLKVLYDYPGERRGYVQWTGPPLSSLPNRYYNWAAYVPVDRPKPVPLRVYLTKERYRRPPVRHRRDTILISGHDGPVWSFWYGYHEALGTLKSFKQGRVEPYTKRRLFAFIDWVMKEFDGDPNRLSAVGGSEALHYGVKHGDKFAYVLADRPDPNPKVTPGSVRVRSYRFRPPLPQREHVWGKVEWEIAADTGKPAWDEMDLISHVRADPKREVAFLSMGPASMSAPWPRQVEFMKTLWSAKQPFCARFYWGGGAHLPVPEGKVGAKTAFDFALNLPMLALRNNSNDRGLTQAPFAEAKAGYWGGGRIADGRRWVADFVDEPDRFEITIHGGGRVTYAGGGASDVTPRRTRKFRPAPGEKFKWENVPLGPRSRYKPQSGEVVADENGLVTIPQVSFRDLSRLKVYKAN